LSFRYTQALELNENVTAIEQWRTTLKDKQRRRCVVHPLSNVRAWRKATAQNKTNDTDDVSKAAAAWRRFVACVNSLPPDQAAPLWQAAQAQANAVLG
jgi:DNA-directed RNA polymerase specialized sigma24 family protein